MNEFTSGDFNKYGNVYSLKSTIVPDASGHVDETDPTNWQLIGPRHFNIVPKGSKEFTVNDQVNANISHQLTTTYDRLSKSFTEKYKFIYQGRTFSLAGPGVNVKERNRWISFPAIESPRAAG